jgi:uncharacterized membrane protein YkoI
MMIVGRPNGRNTLVRNKSALGAITLAALLAAGAAAATTQHFTGEKYLKLTRVSLNDARAVALKAAPGKITSQELEKEKGGTGLRYSFDIRAAGGLREVGVDARTGAILENSKEGAHPD